MSQQQWRRTYLLAPTALAGIGAGCALASLVALTLGVAGAQRPPSAVPAVFEATHLPPLLTLPDEPIHLEYDVHCAAEGIEDPEQTCSVGGTVFVRLLDRGAFRRLRLVPSSADGLRRLTATVPTGIATSQGGFEYYAELETTSGADRLLVPSAGADAPHRSLPLASPTLVDLGAHRFGSTTPGARVVSARWGDGPSDVGLEPGRNLPPTGASAFDVGTDGRVVLLDEANRRALRWERASDEHARVPLSISGRLADLAIDEDGSLHVLESVSEAGRSPFVRSFDRGGHALGVVETAEPSPAQVRIGPDGPVVLQHPSHQWMPVGRGRSSIPPQAQRRGARNGRPLRTGEEVVVLRRPGEILVALVANSRVDRSWRISSRTPLAEVQLVEPLGRRLVLVVRAYSDTTAEFVVLLLDRHGVVRRFATPTDEWAEAAPLARFRVHDGVLYRLGSNSIGAFIERYELEAR